ncbi:HPP - like 1 [Theobroma cacao]|nr:HPP - like 1 [Theobroma cacao]
MVTQLRAHYYYHQSNAMAATSLTSSPSISLNSFSPLLFKGCSFIGNKKIASERSLGTTSIRRKQGREYGVVVASSSNVAAPLWDSWKPEKTSSAASLSDILWPSAGAFAAMAILGKMDQILAPKGISMTIAPLGAVCAVLFATPSSPAARKYNMFMAQIGCAAIGVLAFSIFGPGWLARSAALAASVAFMIYTRSTHAPGTASLPILFIDGVKLHHLNFWYAFFPGAAGCIILSLIVSSSSFRTLELHLIIIQTFLLFSFFLKARSGLLLEGQFQILISEELRHKQAHRIVCPQFHTIFTLHIERKAEILIISVFSPRKSRNTGNHTMRRIVILYVPPSNVYQFL